jgi:hypothetical protein
MPIEISHEQLVLLELIADQPLDAIPELARYTSGLLAAQLIELTPDERWRLTQDGAALLEPRSYWLH